ncbi:hypothetical protein M406DRAFT_335042 [Cryphonectria parasitica EP155]|uniref:Uncharacterized protein n=1 Tax=Cryphonectria parasitica (strain ATCC 38755 / EP155) TaxID=660469 RepID=A0A9P4XS57_CRYP1|nr:uncharacterized protein M406DRAFT_335042 [Cryphonectria parasitica EP155]KAF3760374.1 hypothetical protein M406DRAFT_335042 [Cryphonectria parasitica EP155]
MEEPAEVEGALVDGLLGVRLTGVMAVISGIVCELDRLLYVRKPVLEKILLGGKRLEVLSDFCEDVVEEMLTLVAERSLETVKELSVPAGSPEASVLRLLVTVTEWVLVTVTTLSAPSFRVYKERQLAPSQTCKPSPTEVMLQLVVLILAEGGGMLTPQKPDETEDDTLSAFSLSRSRAEKEGIS